MKTILVPTNFSEASNNALRYATSLAKGLEAEIRLLHVYHPFSTDPGYITDRYAERSQELLKSLEKKLIDECIEITANGLECDWMCIQGNAVEKIPEIAEELKPLLVVLGSDQLNFFDRFLFGTISTSLIRNIEFPTILVPKSYQSESFDRMAYAIDYRKYNESAIQFLLKLNQRLKSELFLTHVADGSIDMNFEDIHFQEFKNGLNQIVNGDKLHYHLLENENVGEAIVDYCGNLAIDLLALSKTKKSFFERIFTGSIGEDIANYTSIPLLFINEDRIQHAGLKLDFEKDELL